MFFFYIITPVFFLKNIVPFYFFLLINLYFIFVVLIKIICILIAVAYFTIAERKIMAAIQRRVGPNIEGGIFGLLQPFCDGLKLFIKELVLPSRANIFIFLFAPLLVFILSLLGWAVLPFYTNSTFNYFLIFTNNYTNNWYNTFIADLNFGIFFLLAISSLNVYGIILGGWASNSKYAFSGALRSSAQMISYEVSIGLTILPVVLLAGSFNFTDIILLQGQTVWFFLPLLPCSIIFFVSMLAETNRAPFDLPEAEAELVAGYNVEYSSMIFALFFLGEYSNMLVMSSFIVVLFFGGWLSPFGCNFWIIQNILAPLIFAIKIIIIAFIYILVRAAFPRYRYDQLMDIGWKIFLPISLGFFIFVSSILISFNILIVANFSFLSGWSV